MNTQKTRRLVFCAFFIAAGITVPIAFHSIPNAGSILLPMHVPVLIAGLLLGAGYGLACGFLTPLASCMLTGMPPVAYLPSMLIELSTYGLVAGFVSDRFKGRAETARNYTALIASMLAGRVLGGIVNALVFRASDYSVAIWTSSYFVGALPGILIQLAAVPAIVASIRRSGLLERKGAAA